jgi:hypothetical protein
MDPAQDRLTQMPSFSYFMLRLGHLPEEPNRVFGVIERLGSGEKRPFDTGEQLMRLVREWLDHPDGPTSKERTP